MVRRRRRRQPLIVDPASGLVNNNLLDQMVDSVVFAMRRLEFEEVRVPIAETGWPHAGDIDQLVQHVSRGFLILYFIREVAKGLMKYQPDIIISVHPLMQHVPLRNLRAKGLLKKIVFTTVITDLSTCHPTWFHKLVTRCYCPSEEVAKRALRAGLQQPQIKVYGLPVQPSFVKPVRPKVD
ncbi:probable monogalactosyldiacylglycerol synthase chloroplastic [Phtheirospermum japonicum]|uniref:Probable monogalactosyldiacylglycerol synthase chloroplastic n=1 Tax=Phtheirospermum japonicum TaxID=374723 RepID=A0A830CQF5_9LAMI|nr:probable monogalactosyldiacylglycerol synthase chloroplastic [Phtheirospermum japonicum]